MSIDMGANSPHATAIFELSERLRLGDYDGDRMQTPEHYEADQHRLDAKFDADLNNIIRSAGYRPEVVRAWAARRASMHPKNQWLVYGQQMREIVFILRLFRGMEVME